MNTPKLFLEVLDLYLELDDDEVLRIELINGNKIYCVPPDDVFGDSCLIKIMKRIKKNKTQTIVIDPNAIVVVCTMSRRTYDLKLQRGELYV